ncbi:hypothetical protein ES702_07363 [subsurface metagenome]
MRTFLVKEADLAGIATDALCTMEIGTKFNHHGLMLDVRKATGVALTRAEIVAQIETISLSVKVKGGPNIRLLKEIPVEVIFDILNEYRDQWKSAYDYDAAAIGIVYISFTRPELGILVDPSALVLGMLDIDSYLLQVKFGTVTDLASIAVIPEVDKGPARPLGEHIRFERWERTFGSTGIEHVTELPFGEPETAMLGYHIDEGATGTIDDVEVRFDGQIMHDPLNIAQNALLLHRAKMTPVAGYFHVDFNRWGGALPVGVAKSFRQKFNWNVAAAPNSYDVYTEMIYSLGAKNYV